MQIKEYPRKNSVANEDFLLVQNANNSAYQSVEKQVLLSGLSAINQPSSDPILGLPNLSSDWCAENVIADANNLISQVTDTSGNQKHAISNASTSRPTLVTNCLSNKPVIRFNGSQYFTHTNLTEPATIIAVLRNRGSGDRAVLGALSDNTTTQLDAYYFKTSDASAQMSFSHVGLSLGTQTERIMSPHTFFIQSGRINQNMIELFINQTLVDRKTFTGTGINISTTASLGAGYFNNSLVDFFLGDIYRVCMFSQPLS